MTVHADAIVVLGCRVHRAGRMTSAASRRADRAARAYHDGVAPLVVASGGRRWEGIAEAVRLAQALAARGVPAGALTMELRSLSTVENAANVRGLLARRGLSRVAVVTCDWHSARAVADFRAAGLEAVALRAEGPAVGPLTRLRRAVHETVSGWLDALALGSRRT